MLSVKIFKVKQYSRRKNVAVLTAKSHYNSVVGLEEMRKARSDDILTGRKSS